MQIPGSAFAKMIIDYDKSNLKQPYKSPLTS